MIYVLEPVLDDPRFRGFEGDPGDFERVFLPRITRNLTVPRLAKAWVPPVVKGKIPPICHYPCINLITPAFSVTAAHCLRDFLEPNGELLPLRSSSGEFFCYNVTTVADVLDVKKSTVRWLEEFTRAVGIDRFEFKRDGVDTLTIFRIPQDPSYLLVTEPFVQRVLDRSLTGLRFVPVWPMPKDYDWRRRSHRRKESIMVNPTPGSAMTVKQAKAQSVRLEFDLAPPKAKERKRLEQFEQEAIEVLEAESRSPFPIAYHECSDDCGDSYHMFFSCPDADAAIKKLRGPIKALKWPRQVRIFRRMGSYDNVEAVEEEVKA